MQKVISSLAMAALLIGAVGGCSPKGDHLASTQPDAPTPSVRATPTSTSQTDSRAAADRAWQTVGRIHTEAAYQGFAREFPKDPQAAKAKTYASRLAWLHAQKAGTSDTFQAFLEHYPDDPHAAEARKMVAGEDISLTEAVHRGWVKSHVSGDGLESVSLTVRRRVRRPLRVSIPTGTLFVSGGASQNMVACEDATADLTSSTSCDLSVSAACANFYLEQPDENNSFSVQKAHPNPKLRKLLAVIAQKSTSAIVRQLAIWSITDNPSRGEAETHTTPGPDADDFRGAAELLRAAGIRPASRRMFQN